MKLRKSAALRLSALFALSATASGQAAGSRRFRVGRPKIEFEKYTLPNGLQVILHDDRKLPIVHVNLWFHVGSKNEKPGRTGFAHLFEHMMFQGSEQRRRRVLHLAEQRRREPPRGRRQRHDEPDRTNYFETVPSANLETLLWLESDRMATCSTRLTQEKLDNQRDVVKNERRQGREPALRPLVLDRSSRTSIPRPSLRAAGHRQPWRTSRPRRSTT